jgi:acyl-CoA synthetase (AMP-forming)/AMP-acid ligase II
MSNRWDKVWPVWMPKRLDVQKPTSEYVREWAERTPDKHALIFFGRNISYRELNNMIDRLANGLIGLGMKKGDRVAIQMDNCPQFPIAYFAAQRAGGIAVPLNPMFKHTELEHEINDAGATVLIAVDYLYGEVEKIRSKTSLQHAIVTSLRDYLPQEPTLPLSPEMEQEKRTFLNTVDMDDLIQRSDETPVCRVDDIEKDLALLQYTGGTTGTPKGAMITHHALAYASVGSMFWYRHREGDVHLGVTPFFHIMGQIQLMAAPLVSGGQVVVLPRFIPDTVARAISLYKVNSWVAATTMVIALLNLPNIKDHDFSSFRILWSGGSPISVELQRQMKELCPDAIVGEGYGLSESLAQGGAITPLHGYKPGFLGIPTISDLKIVDKETRTREMPPNEEGEVLLKGPAITIGYWNRPEETDRMLHDGWLCTGDIGLVDEEGYLKLLGRSRELIKCSGYSVFPAEVEDLLYLHPAIREVAVIGINDPYRGETPKAFVVLKSEYVGKVPAEEILEWCKDNMATYKRPRFIEFRKELPKSAAGKVLRRVLVEEEAKRSGVMGP